VRINSYLINNTKALSLSVVAFGYKSIKSKEINLGDSQTIYTGLEGFV